MSLLLHAYLPFIFLPCAARLFANVERMPFDGIVAFEAALFIDVSLSWVFVVSNLSHTLIYINICTNIWSCIDDLKMLSKRIDDDIEQHRSGIFRLTQFIELQKNIYW